MPARRKKILIIDEKRFCRICSALLKVIGFGTETYTPTMTDGENLSQMLDSQGIGLIVTSYPYGHFMLHEIKKSRIPFIILSDNIDQRLMEILKGLTNAYCMIKPIDYKKLRELAREIMSTSSHERKGFSII